jgi:ABC-2 type transport system permease protein
MGYADVVSLTFSQDVAIRWMQSVGGPSFAPPLEVRPRVWFNADMESRNYIVPGLTAVIMMVISALLTSLTVAREWERGTMEQLISTPVKGYELVLGKLAPYFAVGMFDMLLAVLMGKFLFHVPLRGDAVLLFAIAAVFLAGILSMGMLVSILMKSQLLASQIAMVLTFLPSFLLSGFVYPISNMAKPVQWISYAVPARYFVALMRAIYLKGTGLELLAGEIALLVVFGAIMLALANARFKKKLT